MQQEKKAIRYTTEENGHYTWNGQYIYKRDTAIPHIVGEN